MSYRRTVDSPRSIIVATTVAEARLAISLTRRIKHQLASLIGCISLELVVTKRLHAAPTPWTAGNGK